MNLGKPLQSASEKGAGGISAWVAASFVALVAGRVIFFAAADPLPDEAYYWLWGQHPALSYYDHPPLQAWLQAASTAVFGANLFGLRGPSLLTTGWMVLLLVWWTRRASALGASLPAPVAIAVFFSAPVITIQSMFVFHDHLLIALVSTAAAAFTVVFDDMTRAGRVNAPALYSAGLAIGLACLTKYNAVLFGLGAALAIVVVPRLRPLLRSPHLYAAAALAAACMTPVILWNAQNQAESFQYNLVVRFSRTYSLSSVAEHVTTFTLLTLGTFSIFAAVGLVRCLRERQPAAWAVGWRPLAISTAIVPTLAFLAMTPFTPVLFYWNVVACLAFLPYAALYMGRRLIAAHLGVGMLVALLIPLNYALLPLSALFGPSDAESALTYGWDGIARRIEQERAERGADFLLASDYRIGAILAFQTGDTSVEVISPRRSQFDLWFDEARREGQDALVLADDSYPLNDRQRHRFGSIEKITDLPVVRFGHTLKTYTLYHGSGYIAR